ncbi:MAG: FAD-dependent oxidoreductase [Vampirovibrionales bacterium]|nr:FAD-dependent oxidoreductase [Vampirovibrionales bacterium]
MNENSADTVNQTPALYPVQSRWDVIVVGAGVAGLRAAQVAYAAGKSVLIIETTERIGGRIATDWVEGFALDRGFQVVLTAYPELKKALHLEDLQLKSFVSGAWVFTGNQTFYPLYDPLRHPIKAFGSLFKSLSVPFLTAKDIVQTIRLRWDIVSKPESACWNNDGLSTLEYLRQRGFSEPFIAAFWMPFLRGVFLDAELSTPASLFRFIFRMFALGTAALPAGGMETLPKTMASTLPSGVFRMNMGVQSATATSVLLESGETLQATSVIGATPSTSEKTVWRGTTCVYYGVAVSPINEAVLVLNGTGRGLINTLCVPTWVHPAYRAQGTKEHLVSVSLLGVHPNPRQAIESELANWFGNEAVDSWRWLKTDVIPHALPVWCGAHPILPTMKDTPIVCGDGASYPSLNGALFSGASAANQALSTFY